MDINSKFQQAVSLHKQDRLSDAESLYRAVLTQDTVHFGALHMLGILHHQKGHQAEALQWIDRALGIDPGNAAAHSNRGMVLHALGRPEQALAACERALELMPENPEALNNRGNALAELGRAGEALASYERAIQLRAGYTEAHLNRGKTLRLLNRPDEALLSFDYVLQRQPNSADAHLSRGHALRDLGRNEDALESYRKASRIKPTDPEAYMNCGIVLRSLKRNEEAVAHFDQALALNPRYTRALSNRGNALVDLKRMEEAITSYDRALEIDPDYKDALINRGNVLLTLKRFAEALANHDRAIEIDPASADAWMNRGNALSALERAEEALDSYSRALSLRPEFAEAYLNQGNALLRLNRAEDALLDYERALRLSPDFPEALNGYGSALRALRQFEQSLAMFDRTLRLKPDYAEAHMNRGNVLVDLRRPTDALASYEKALELKPVDPDTLNNRANALRDLRRFGELASTYEALLAADPEYEYALGFQLHARLQVCDWSDYAGLTSRIADGVARGEKRSVPFAFLIHCDDAAAQSNCARIYAQHKYPASSQPLWAGERYQHGRIRIAYLSSDFHTHATAFLISELFELHDRTQFETFAFSFGPDEGSEIRQRLKRAFEHFIDVRDKSDRQAAQLLRDHEIDIAIDLKGFTQDSRMGIFAYRPAPVQVNYLGYPGSVALDYIDYVVADARVIPEGHDKFYREKIIRLPDSYQPNDRHRPIAEQTPSRSELGLPDRGFVFCCFNNNYKITPTAFDVWMRLLTRVERSVLWLLEDNTEASRNLRREAEARGVPSQRIVFAPRLPLEKHLARHKCADLFLDTLPCNAHTTASDALWAGLPLLTCMGQSFVSRVAGSLLHAAGLPELVTHDLGAYERLALELAHSPSQLNDLRAKLARNHDSCALFDTARFRRHIESAYVHMYERLQRGESPEAFAVLPT